MTNTTSSDLPPAYYTITLSSEELTLNVEKHDSESLIGNSFDNNKNARVIFTLKVLSIFLLQTVAVGIVLGIFAFYQIILHSDLIGVAVVAYLITILVMVYMHDVENRRIYNYFILVYYPFMITFVLVMLPSAEVLFNDNHTVQARIRQTIFSAWVSYILAVFSTLFYGIFCLHSRLEFRLRSKMLIAIFVMAASYFCITLPLYLISDVSDPFNSCYVTLFLCCYYLYILHDIDAMAGTYRTALTPNDYVTGAVNLQTDFMIAVMDFTAKMYRSDTSDGDDDDDDII